MEVVGFVDEGLGHSSYLVDLGDGRALVVDPPRLPLAHLDEARARGLEIVWTADSHSHADYVSGSPELAARGAQFVASSGAGLEVAHRGLDDGDEIVLRDGLVLRAIATPGHTPDHLAYLLLEKHQPVALFSGGSLMVGAVGRTDLLGPEPREELTRRMFRSLRDRVLTLPDDVAVYPTHGAGSFCSAPGATDRTTTIGRERATNPLLQIGDEDAFVDALLAGLGSFPAYFSRLPEVNRRGPRLYGALPKLPTLDLDAFQAHMATGAVVVDARPIRHFGSAYIPGALSIELRPVFASWLGWLTDARRPLLFVLDDDQDPSELVRQCLAVGHENLVGALAGGMRTWRDSDLPVASIPLVGPDAVTGTLLDVRQQNEFVDSHVPGANNVELGALADATIADGAVTVMCGHGERAMTGASVLAARAHTDLRVLAGGPTEWAATTGGSLVCDA
jgi:glyoxylase-like metal-dependent hydrolase (beta-lactamase superfamily II)/rhodanese-related sulfurtransferase